MRVSASPAFRNRRSNPYNALLYDALASRGIEIVEFGTRTTPRKRPDIVHVHWPESALNKRRRAAAAFRSFELLVALTTLRLRGVKVVWTVHNLHSHYRRYPRAERFWWACFTRVLSGWTALSESGAEAARAEHPRLRRLPMMVIPHGDYRTAYRDVTRSKAREWLKLSDENRLVLFVGRVKPYKAVPTLVSCFQATQAKTWRLLIAGRCDDQILCDELRELAVDSRVTLQLSEVPDDGISLLLRAADLVVLPFDEVLNSGSAILALSFSAPVLVPRLGAMGELAAEVPGWVTTYAGPLTSAVLEEAMVSPRPRGRPELSQRDWQRIAELTENFYASLLTSHDSRL